MRSKKIFFPLGAGEDYRERFYGALLVARHFGAHMEVLRCQIDPGLAYNIKSSMRGSVLYEQFLTSARKDLENENESIKKLFETTASELGVKVSKTPVYNVASADFIIRTGNRSRIVEAESKFCDMVVAAVPLDGKITGTFESAVVKSGKSVIVIPRNLTSFSANNVLISWSGTAQSSRALSASIPILEKANKVHCITSRASLGDDLEINLSRLKEYFDIHDIKATFEVIDITSIPGEALLKAAHSGGHDLIVAGRHGENGLREIFLGGTSKFFLQNTDIPIFL